MRWEEKQESEPKFNHALFTSHVLCHEKDRDAGKASILQATFLIEGNFLKGEEKINNANVKQCIGISGCQHVV